MTRQELKQVYEDYVELCESCGEEYESYMEWLENFVIMEYQIQELENKK
jgi:hypothetical protein